MEKWFRHTMILSFKVLLGQNITPFTQLRLFYFSQVEDWMFLNNQEWEKWAEFYLISSIRLNVNLWKRTSNSSIPIEEVKLVHVKKTSNSSIPIEEAGKNIDFLLCLWQLNLWCFISMCSKNLAMVTMNCLNKRRISSRSWY
jgi:hypothetical protein